MNARVVKNLIIAVVAAAGAAACAGRPGGDPPSAMDARVSAVVAAQRAYPRWRDFPAAPAALPADTEIAAAVGRLDAGQTALARDAAAIDWTLADPEAFAAATRRRVDAARTAPVTQQTAETLEAFAEGLRERGRAPPPIPRRPQP